MYEEAWEGKIRVLQKQLESKKPVDQALLATVRKEYVAFMNEYPNVSYRR